MIGVVVVDYCGLWKVVMERADALSRIGMRDHHHENGGKGESAQDPSGSSS